MTRPKHILTMIPMAAAIAPGAMAQNRPNIIHIMSDDHAYQAISAYGDQLSEHAPTPNLDRLASEGMMFRRAYVENSLSTPSRACLFTGLYSHQNGQRGLGRGIDTTKTFVSEILQQNGYQTGVVGKWHMQCTPKGFDWYEVFYNQGEYYNPGVKTPLTEGRYERQEGYATELVTERAISFIENRDTTRPFCLFVHHKAPHRNWMPALKYIGLFDDIEFPMPDTFYDDYQGRGAAEHRQEMSIDKDMTMEYDLHVPGWGAMHGFDETYAEYWGSSISRLSPEEREYVEQTYARRNAELLEKDLKGDDLVRWKYQRYVRDYLSVIRSVDDSVGELLEYLEAQGLLDNTVIVYTSDQGFYMGEHGWFDKRFMFEESFRTPLLIRYPAMIKPGSVSDALVQNIDFAPTYLDLAGIEKPEEMVGTSIVPVLKKEGKSPRRWRRYLYYHYYDYPAEHNVLRHDGVFDKRWKLIHFYDPEGKVPSYDELFDLRHDPQELRNVIGERSSRRALRRLRKQLERFRTEQAIDEI